jgi:hypothetical protein
MASYGILWHPMASHCIHWAFSNDVAGNVCVLSLLRGHRGVGDAVQTRVRRVRRERGARPEHTVHAERRAGPGRAVRVDPIKSKLKLPGTKRLKP